MKARSLVFFMLLMQGVGRFVPWPEYPGIG